VALLGRTKGHSAGAIVRPAIVGDKWRSVVNLQSDGLEWASELWRRVPGGSILHGGGSPKYLRRPTTSQEAI